MGGWSDEVVQNVTGNATFRSSARITLGSSSSRRCTCVSPEYHPRAREVYPAHDRQGFRQGRGSDPHDSLQGQVFLPAFHGQPILAPWKFDTKLVGRDSRMLVDRAGHRYPLLVIGDRPPCPVGHCRQRARFRRLPEGRCGPPTVGTCANQRRGRGTRRNSLRPRAAESSPLQRSLLDPTEMSSYRSPRIKSSNGAAHDDQRFASPIDQHDEQIAAELATPYNRLSEHRK